MNDTTDEDRPTALVTDHLIPLVRFQRSQAERIAELEDRLSAARIDTAWTRWASLAAVLIVGAVVNLATPWFSGEESVDHAFGLLGAAQPAGWMLLYLVVGGLAAMIVAFLAMSSSHTSTSGWYLLAVAGVVMTVAAVLTHGTIPRFHVAQAGLRLAVVLPIVLVVVSLSAALALRDVQLIEGRRRLAAR